MSQLIPSTTPIRTFKDHKDAIAVFPNKRQMVTGSWDKTLRLWDLEIGVVLKKMEGHSNRVQALAVSRDGQIIASGDEKGEIIGWHGETGKSLTKPIRAHSNRIYSVDFSLDGAVLATGSFGAVKFWCTKTWQMQGEPIKCGTYVYCIRYSPSGELLAIATYNNIQIYNPSIRQCVASFGVRSSSLAWTPDGTRLLSAGDHTIREWDTLTWKQVGDSWGGHSKNIHAISLNSSGTLLASASHDNHVRLWRLSDRRNIATFKHSDEVNCVTFSADDKHILSGGVDKKISEWPTSEGGLAKHDLKDGLMKEQETHQVSLFSFLRSFIISASFLCQASSLLWCQGMFPL
jgi:WD40 repeat protein